MKTLLIGMVSLVAVGCGGGGAPAPNGTTGPTAAGGGGSDEATSSATLSDDDCKQILASALESAKPGGPPSEPAAVLSTKVEAKALKVRIAGSAVCASWRTREVCSEELEDGACPDEAGGSDTMWVIGVVDPAARSLTDKREYSGAREMTESSGQLSWKAVAIAADKDALVLTSADESGDSSTSAVEWLTVAGGKFVEHMSYKYGIDGGEEIGTVEYKVLDDVVNGYFAIEITVEKDGEKATDTCAWNTGETSYTCKKDLLGDL